MSSHHALTRSLAGRDLSDRGYHDHRLGRFDRGRLALDIRGRRAALLLLGLRLRPLLRRRRGRRLGEIDHSKDALRACQLAFAVEIEKDEQKREMNPDHRRDGTAAIPITDVRSVGHALSTRAIGCALRLKKERRAKETRSALGKLNLYFSG